MVVAGGLPDADRSVIGPVPSLGKGFEYKAARGTSFSAAFAAGMAAVVRAQHPTWPDRNVAAAEIADIVSNRIAQSAVSVDMPFGSGGRPRVLGPSAVASGPVAPVVGDCDGDLCVGSSDVGILLGYWGSLPDDGSLHLVDVDRDFSVGPADLGTLLGSWSPCP